MSEFELYLRLLWILLVVIYIYWSIPVSNSGKRKNNTITNNNNSKLIKKIEREQLTLENLLIQKEEYENEINRLEFESSSDFEKESTNNTKIKKLRLKIRHLLISIDEKNNRLNELNNKLWTSMN